MSDKMPLLLAAANHSLSAGDASAADSMTLTEAFLKGTTTGAGIGAGAAIGGVFGGPLGAIAGAVVGGVTGYDWKMTAATTVSGLNQFYNSATSLISLAPGIEIQQQEASNWMRSLDDDLSKYYESHKEGVDLAGFIVGAIPAGMGAVKVYNYGMKALKSAAVGEIGSNMSAATGLLRGKQAQLLSAAESEMQASGAAFNLLNRKFVAAAALGAGEAAIEGFVAEAGVQLALNASPILSKQDAGDIAKNMWTATWLGGAVGGVLGTAIDAYRLTKNLGKGDIKTLSARRQAGFEESTPTQEQILLNYVSRDNISIPKIDPADPNYDALIARSKREAAKTVEAIDNDIRAGYHKLADGDAVIGNVAHEAFNVMLTKYNKDVDEVARVIKPTVSIARINTVTKPEKWVEEVRSYINKTENPKPEAYDILDKYVPTYMRIWGHKANTVLDSAPRTITLWDSVKKGNAIKVTDEYVNTGDNLFKFKTSEAYDIRNETNVIAANARTLWAYKLKAALPEDFKITEYNTPLIEKAIKDMADGKVNSIKIVKENSAEITITSAEDLTNILRDVKIRVANEKLSKLEMPDESLASILNVKPEWLTNEQVNVANAYSDIHAMQSYIGEYADSVKNIPTAATPDQVLLGPQTVKMIVDTGIVEQYEQLAKPFLVYAKQQQKIYKVVSDTASAAALGKEIFEELPELGDNFIGTVTRNPAGGTMFKHADGSYGTAAAIAERVGQVIYRAKQNMDNAIHGALDSLRYKLVNNTAASAEYAAITTKIMSSPDRYILDLENNRYILKEYAKHLEKLANGEKSNGYKLIDPNSDLTIEFKSDIVRDLVAAHHELNAARLPKFNNMRALGQGEQLRSPEDAYFPPPNPADYSHYAFVTDPQVTGTRNLRMIWAESAEKLDEMLATIPAEFKPGIIKHPGKDVKTGPEMARWKKAIDDYSRDDALTDNYFDAVLHRSGVSTPYIPAVDGKLLAERLIKWHKRQEHNLIEEAVAIKYAPEFRELDNLARGYADAMLSKVPGKSTGFFKPGFVPASEIKAKAGSMRDNPYYSYINTMLSRANTSEIPFKATQDLLDHKVSQAYRAVTDFLDNTVARRNTPEDLDTINSIFQDYGLNHVNYDSLKLALANHTIARGSLDTFTRRLKGIVAGIGLGWDPFHMVVNRVGLMVRLAPEIQYIRDNIAKANPEAVGRLAELGNVNIPDGSYSYFSPMKVIGKAIKEAFKPENKAWAKNKGFSINHIAEVDDAIDHIALGLGQKVVDLDTLMDSAYAKFDKIVKAGGKVTGNIAAEEWTRLTSALAMKQFTDLAVDAGIMLEKEADSFIQTFVNRSNGVYIASQRPMMFNGPIGQSMGLYQTYYISLLNQMLRYAAEGERRSLALMMAAQGTIFGMGGLPGFQAINTSIVAELAGNSDKTDMFSAAYNSMDKNAADWLMYGALSNIPSLINPELKLNLYSRGDINPRNISIVPLDPREHAAVQISSKFFNNAIDTIGKLAGGAAVVPTLLSGLEHNGLSRPLSGLGQVLRAFTNDDLKAYATTKQGSLIGANDLMSFTSLARIAGARPLDEAIANDFSYRQLAYAAKTRSSIANLGAVIKSKLTGGGTLSNEDVVKFATEYVKLGGDIENWNRYIVKLYADANTSLSNRLVKSLKDPQAQKLMMLMGGIQDNSLI